MQSINDVQVRWKPVYRFEGLYEVSTLGNIRAVVDIVYQSGSRFGKKGTIAHKAGSLLNVIDGEYYKVSLYDPTLKSAHRTKGLYVHEIVSESFQGHEDGLVVDHIDGNKHNNRLSNLQRISNIDNCLKAYRKDESQRWSKRKCAVIRDDGVIYNNLQEAIVANHIKSNTSIINAIKRNGKCNGHYWKYADAEKQNYITQNRAYTKIPHKNRSTWVRCIDTNEIALNSDMQRHFNVADSVIYDAIRFHGGYSKYLDKSFEFVDESAIDFDSEAMQTYIKNSTSLKNTRIMCKETGVVYTTIKQAAERLHISADYIKRSIHNNFTGKYGLTFIKI